MPQESLDSFAPEFRQGMAARAAELGDVGESDPGNWEKPLGTQRRPRRRRGALARRRAAGGRRRRRPAAPTQELPGVELIWRQDCYQLPTGRTSFGFKDGIGQPAVEGSGRPSSELRARRRSRPARSSSAIPTRPASCRPCPRRRCSAATAPTSSSASCTPGWRRTGSTCARRPRAARRRRCLGAKMVGRWQSGAPLAVSPDRDDPELGADPLRNNDFGYADDPRGFKCPAGAHARRANPRDALDHDGSVNVRLHRMIRRGTSYGPMLPDGVLEDDGADRGIIFVFAGAHLRRQFEFVKTQWLNDGIFIGAPAEKDPLVGPNDGSGVLHHPPDADPPAAARGAAVRRHPRRRVLLRPGPARPALAGGARHMNRPRPRRGRRDHERGRHRSLGRPRLRSAAGRRRRARLPGARRLPLRRSHRRRHAEPAARRQRDHHRDGRPPHRGRRDDRGPPRRPGRRPHRRRGPGLLRRQRPAAAQEHDQGGLAPPAAGLRPHALHGPPAAQARSSPPSTGSPTAAARSWRRASTSSSPPTTPPSASPRR